MRPGRQTATRAQLAQVRHRKHTARWLIRGNTIILSLSETSLPASLGPQPGRNSPSDKSITRNERLFPRRKNPRTFNKSMRRNPETKSQCRSRLESFSDGSSSTKRGNRLGCHSVEEHAKCGGIESRTVRSADGQRRASAQFRYRRGPKPIKDGKAVRRSRNNRSTDDPRFAQCLSHEI